MPANLEERDYFKTWVVYYVCSLACGAVLGAFVGVFAGSFGEALQLDRRMVAYGTQIAVFVLSLPISYLLFRFFVNRFITRKLVDPFDDASAA